MSAQPLYRYPEVEHDLCSLLPQMSLYVARKVASSVVLSSLMTSCAAYTGGQIAEVIDIPATMVGKLIGKAGETIKQLQYSTNTKVGIRSAPIGSLMLKELI